MFRNVFLKSLRDQYRGLIGWTIGVMVLVLVMALIWPSVRDMPDIDRLLANYPEAMRELFNVEAITTGPGFMNAELFSIILPAMFLVFAIGRGARLLAGEEQAGTLEVLLTTPVPRAQVLLEKAAALAVSVAVLGLALFASTVASAALVGMDVPPGEAAVGSLAMVLLGLEHGWLAFATGAATGRRVLSIGVAGTVAVVGYVLYVVGALVEAMEPWRSVSPFQHALKGGPIGGGVGAGFGWMAVVAIVVLLACLPVFHRRDVPA
ncbi:MAG: ABC transporter permease [Actinomycetota bacterium]